VLKFSQYLLSEILTPDLIYILAFFGSIAYLVIFKLQSRFNQTNSPDLISSGIQCASLIGGTKLILQGFLDLSESTVMAMDKLYCGYGGVAVIWISFITLLFVAFLYGISPLLLPFQFPAQFGQKNPG
jgi:hypothetical protein